MAWFSIEVWRRLRSSAISYKGLLSDLFFFVKSVSVINFLNVKDLGRRKKSNEGLSFLGTLHYGKYSDITILLSKYRSNWYIFQLWEAVYGAWLALRWRFLQCRDRWDNPESVWKTLYLQRSFSEKSVRRWEQVRRRWTKANLLLLELILLNFCIKGSVSVVKIGEIFRLY